MKREFLIALFVCFCLGMTGCDASKEVAKTNQVQTEVEAEHNENEDVAVSDMDETTDETSEDDVAKDTTTVDDVLDLTESNVIVRDSLELDKKHTKVQIITDEDYTFEDDFILEYTDAIPEYKEVINISNYYVKEYDLGDDKFVYIIREDDEGALIGIYTLIYKFNEPVPFEEIIFE